jgi:hypothetical protein
LIKQLKISWQEACSKQTLQAKEDFDAHMKEMKDKIFVLENKK